MAHDRSTAADSLVHALAGAASSGIALAALFPLDQARLHRQLEREGSASPSTLALYRKLWREGALYTGLRPSVLGIVLANFFYHLYA